MEDLKKKRIARFIWYVYVFLWDYLLRFCVCAMGVAKYQKRQLSRIIKYAKKNCIYYQDLLQEQDINESNCEEVLKMLPILTKEIIRTEGDRVFSKKINLSKCKINNTGGSTGQPLSFPCYKSILPLEGICQRRLLRNMGWKYRESIICFDGTALTDKEIRDNVFYKESYNFPYGKYHFSARFISDITLTKYIEQINFIKPTIIRSYPSAMIELVKLMKNNKLSFSFSLKGVILTSEMWTKDDEKLISSYLNCPVWGQYGHSEISIFAVCPESDSRYYASYLYGYTEVLDVHTNQHVKEGEVGEVIVTGFLNRGLPFLRYSTGDLARYGGLSTDGEVIIDNLYGRNSDYIVNASGEKIFLVGFIFGSHIHAFNNIFAWQLEQFHKGEVKLIIHKDINYSEADEKELKLHFEKIGINVFFDYGGQIQKTNRGKQPFILQHIK